jgi:LuxR family maltose regulon positive regulatory protein
MPKNAYRRTPLVMSACLYTEDEHTGTRLDTPAWFAWLETGTTFAYQSPLGSFTARCEPRRRGGSYWVAYRRVAGRLHRIYLGKSDQLSRDCLDRALVALAQPPQA